ncbi:glutathione S-transferase family protein [Tepidicaulis sp. LMO-SS28]|uniref:glutathione S-transferase family protein n=1 Tax=Tepidicaulis sp. LMO-SS28 TaxID=3447455 RepID=UPI003EE1BDBE
MRLYNMHNSGNCYKVRLTAHQLGVPLDITHVDVLAGETRQAEFIARNPNGRVPLLELDDGRFLAESNAIIFHLAEGSPLIPQDAYERAQMLQWMFFEQYSHEPYIAVARFWFSIKPGGRAETTEAQRELWRTRGTQALEVMERHLTETPYFVGGRYSLADIALYAYTHAAHEGDFDLPPYPAIRAWLARVESEPRHIPMEAG